MPTQTQLDAAVTALHADPTADVAVVSLVLVNKEFGVWTSDIEVHPAPGVWLARATGSGTSLAAAIAEAERAAQRVLGERPGTVSWAVVRRDRSAAMFESFR